MDIVDNDMMHVQKGKIGEMREKILNIICYNTRKCDKCNVANDTVPCPPCQVTQIITAVIEEVEGVEVENPHRRFRERHVYPSILDVTPEGQKRSIDFDRVITLEYGFEQGAKAKTEAIIKRLRDEA